MPPDACIGEGLMVSFDMLNFYWPFDYGNLVLEDATIETLLPPEAP
jgi:hypothetical protein